MLSGSVRNFHRQASHPGSARGALGLITIDHFVCEQPGIVIDMKTTQKEASAIRCPTCGAKPGEKCELSTGLPRTDSHRDRRLAASKKVNDADTLSLSRAATR